MVKKLTEQQQKFLDVLFDEAGGDVIKAKKLAGYANNYPSAQVVKTLEEEIISLTKLYLSRNGPKAAIGLVGVLDNPTELGVKEKLIAAKDILDRIGVSKTENLNITGGGAFILPPKDE